MLVRFGDVIDFGDPSAWVYLGVIASFFVLGAYGLTAHFSARSDAGGRSGHSVRSAAVPTPAIPTPPPPP
jgi:hypothetical protein